MSQHEHIVIKIDTSEMYLDRNKMSAWAKSIRLLLSELAFEVGNGDWEFGPEGRQIDIYDSGCYSSGGKIGTVTIVVEQDEDN